MAFIPEKDAEPIPGYRLVEKLGRGGYGEVWKTTAPGGLTKALKIIYGDMAGAQAEQELKALERIKEVRHPFLLSLERYEVIGTQLFIVTELADACLQDRYNACRQSGLWGIPRDELLIYLRDAAEALDYMGETHGLQHLDIKPQNLLLVGGRIKVADFGLVKKLVGTSVTATGGVTPVYATPEAFDGRVSRFSDQYSLAIVYQEMLTGVRPFPGKTAMQLAAQHSSSPPLLDPLPPSDRPVIARALAKTPENRFPTCREMVNALLKGQAPAPLPPTAPEVLPRSQGVRTPIVAPGPGSSAGELEDVLGMSTEVGPLPSFAQPTPPPPAEEPTVGRSTPTPTATGPKPGLRPTLVVGIGGLARAALRRLRQQLEGRFGELETMPIFRMLLVDTDRAELRLARQGEAEEALTSSETLLTPLHAPEHYRGQAKTLLRWIDRRWLYGIPRSLLTEGLRPLGRLALVDNAETVRSWIREALAAITNPEAIRAATAAAGLPLREESPRVFVVASITGGTGGGMLVSMAYAIRQVLADLGLPAEGLCGLLAYASSPKPSEQEMARINAYATLSELNHFSRPDALYPGDPDYGLVPFGPSQAPFDDCYLVHLGDQLNKDESAAAAGVLAEYLRLDLSPAGGAFLDQYRQATRTDPGDNAPLRSFGLFRISSPGKRLLEQAAGLLGRRLVDRWLSGAGEAEIEDLQSEAQDRASSLGLEEKALIQRFHAAATGVLGERPDTYFAKLVGLAAPEPSVTPAGDSAPAPRSTPPGDPTRQLLAKIDAVLGTGPDPKDLSELIPTALESSLRGKVKELAIELGRKIVEWLLDLVETPGQRLKSADGAAAALSQHLIAAADGARSQLSHLRAQRLGLRQQFVTGTPGGSGIRWLGLGRAPGDAPVANRKFLDYCTLRLNEIALENAVAALNNVYGQLANFAQDLVLCRQNLGQITASLRAPSVTPASPRPTAPFLLELLPGQAANLDAAAMALINSLPADFLNQFDESFQTEVLNHKGGLWSLVAGDSDPMRRAARESPDSVAYWDLVARYGDAVTGLKEALLARSRGVIRRVLQESNAAQLFLDARGGPSQAGPVLLAHVLAAAPRLKVPGGWEHLVLALPRGQAGDALRELIRKEYLEVPTTVLPSADEVVLCFEAAHYPLQRVAEAVAGRETAHADLAERVRTRLDVTWRPLTPSPV
jgi:serine/threonine protein kinase